MKVAIIGSRKFKSFRILERFINDNINFKDIDLIISGGAEGADTFAEIFAYKYNISKKIIYPNWEKYGKKAGFLRNIQIVKLSDVVFAFWDGCSKGTKHSIDLASECNKILYVCYYVREVHNISI